MGFLNEHGLETLWAKIKSIVPTKTSDLINDGDGGSPADPFVQESDLAAVAKTGSYNDLEDTPDIPANTSDLTNDGSDGTSTYVETDELEEVAFSGDYEDLNNKPEIPAAQVAADWNKDGDDYVDGVKNRTHYEIAIDPLVTIESGTTTFDWPSETLPTAGETYTIEILQGPNAGLYSAEGVADGNGVAIHGTGERPDYFIMYNENGGFWGQTSAYYMASSDYLPINIYSGTYSGNVVHQLDEKFIPDSIARTSQIPSVDQHYNSSSANAQSGIAVAEAIAPMQEVIPVTASSSNQLVDTNTLVDAIQQQVTEYIAPDASMIVPFEHATYMGGANNLEDGPWYKDGLKCGEEGSPIVYVTENDYAVVLQDESVCYFEAHGFRYQRHKDGGATDYGYAVLPDANHTHAEIHPVTSGTYQGALYFEDDSLTFSEDSIFYIVTDLSVLSDSVVETDSLSGSPIATYDLNFPTTRYVCTTSQTDSTPPVWSFNYTVNDTALTGNQIQALNSGINSTLVNKLNTLATVATTGDYADLSNKPLSSISVTQSTQASTASNPETTTTTITIDGTGKSIKSFTKIDTEFSSSSKNPVANSVINNALSNKVEAEDFQALNDIALTTLGMKTDVKLPVKKQISGAGTYPSKKNSYQWEFGKSDDPTYFKIYDVSQYPVVHLKSVSRAGHILTNSDPEVFASRVQTWSGTKFTEYPESGGDQPGTNSEQADVQPKTGWHAYDKDITTNGKHYLIVYEVNAMQAIEVTNGGGYAQIPTSMFLNDGEGGSPADPYAKMSDISSALPTHTSDLINDGEGGSPTSRYVEEWEFEATTSDLDYIMGEN